MKSVAYTYNRIACQKKNEVARRSRGDVVVCQVPTTALQDLEIVDRARAQTPVLGITTF
jgi:hypothetical protein